MDPDQTAPLGYKNRYEKFARLFSRRHKQMTFSDAGFLGILRVNKVCCETIYTMETPHVCSVPYLFEITECLFNSFGAKCQTKSACFFNKLSLGKKFVCKVERLNVKQRRSR